MASGYQYARQDSPLPRPLACHPFPRDLSLQDAVGIRKTLSGSGRGAPRQAGKYRPVLASMLRTLRSARAGQGAGWHVTGQGTRNLLIRSH